MNDEKMHETLKNLMEKYKVNEYVSGRLTNYIENLLHFNFVQKKYFKQYVAEILAFYYPIDEQTTFQL